MSDKPPVGYVYRPQILLCAYCGFSHRVKTFPRECCEKGAEVDRQLMQANGQTEVQK